jgi:hypothetical protein
MFSVHVLLRAVNAFVLQSAFRKSETVTASIVLTSMYLLSLDKPSEVIYWFSGAITYQLANVLFTLFLATLVSLFFAKTRVRRFLLLTASLLLLLLIVGLNETSMVLALSTLGLSVLYLFSSHNEEPAKSYRVMLMSVLIVGAMASLFVICAPGNSVRLQFETQLWGWNQADSISELLQAGFNALIWAAISSLRWIVTKPYHCFAILLVLAATSNFPRRVEEYIGSNFLLWFPVIGFALMWLTAFTSFYLGFSPPARTIASIYVVFWLSFIPSSLALMRRYGWVLQGRGLIAVLKVGLVGSMLLHPNHPLAEQNLRDAVLYRLQLQERDRLVSKAIEEGHRDIVVPRLIRVPAILRVGDLGGDKSSNGCYASYRNIDSIVARGDGDTSEIVREFKKKVSDQISRVVPWRR